MIILEEVRVSTTVDMYARVRELLPQYETWWRPVMNYTTQYPGNPTSEGICILWLPGTLAVPGVVSRDIPYDAACVTNPSTCPDLNMRAVDWIVARTSGDEPLVNLSIFGTHLSTDEHMQLDNADFISEWIANLSTAAQPRVVMGDLNAHWPNNGLLSHLRGFANATESLGCT